MSSTELSSVVEGLDLLTLSTIVGRYQCYKDGSIEFRPGTLAQWRRLAPTDVLQHVELGTIVAQWLKARLGASRSENRGIIELEPEPTMRFQVDIRLRVPVRLTSPRVEKRTGPEEERAEVGRWLELADIALSRQRPRVPAQGATRHLRQSQPPH